MKPGQFHPDRLAMKLGVLSTGERHAVLFLLNVWNPAYAQEMGWRFEAVDALGMWDDGHRTAFLAWAQHPFFP